jgi:hypothetical protein
MIGKCNKWGGFKLLSATIVAILATLTGCSSPYSPPVLDEPGLAVGAEPAFDGILDHAVRNTDGPLRVGVVHGMCDHDRSWAENRLSLYAKAFGIQDPSSLEPLPMVDGIERYRALLSPPGVSPIEFVFVVWSPLSESIKDNLLYDAAPPTGIFPFRRARLNGELKETLLNRCLADAIVYLGQAGDPIRSAMERVACELLGGGLDGHGVCRSAGEAMPANLVFVTESLGSKVLFDAVRNLRERTAADPEEAVRLEKAVGRTQALYLVSNQVPLLDLGAASMIAVRKEGPPQPSSLVDFLAILNAGRAGGVGRLDGNPLTRFEIDGALTTRELDITDATLRKSVVFKVVQALRHANRGRLVRMVEKSKGMCVWAPGDAITLRVVASSPSSSG